MQIVHWLRHRRLWALALFPVVLQANLEALGGLGLLYLPVIGFTALAFVACATVTVASWILRRPSTIETPAFFCSYLAAAMLAGKFLVARQYADNKARADVVAHAIEDFYEARGQWPAGLESLPAKPPMWRFGLLNYQFIYWQATGAKYPTLKFARNGFTSMFYSFENRRWYESTM